MDRGTTGSVAPSANLRHISLICNRQRPALPPPPGGARIATLAPRLSCALLVAGSAAGLLAACSTGGSGPAGTSGAAPSGSQGTATEHAPPTGAGSGPSSVASAPTGGGTTAAAPSASGAAPSGGQGTPAGTARPVVITYDAWNASAGQAEVAAYAQGRDAQPGRCVLTLTQGAARVQVSRDARADVVTTDCGTMIVPGSRLAAGEWVGTVSYQLGPESSDSDPFRIEVVK